MKEKAKKEKVKAAQNEEKGGFRVSKRPQKNSSLDNEQPLVLKKIVAELNMKREFRQPFQCFRCNKSKVSKNTYEWQTSQGVKTICNGCNGFLLSLHKRLSAADTSPPAADAAADAADADADADADTDADADADAVV